MQYLLEYFKAPKLLKLLHDSLEYQKGLSPDAEPSQIGKLSVKLEAAGKVRVFAIVDGWTQMALLPLHKSLFALLKKIPNDGTFNQGAPLRDLLSRIGPDRECFSFDLSAATDRLPVDLQVQILSMLTGSSELAGHWKSLLVGRDYVLSRRLLSSNKISNPVGFPEEGDLSLRYAVGQPMGALSS